MTANTKIEWAHHTFNPWVGCVKVSPACDHCYAEGWAKRSGMVQWGANEERRRTSDSNWNQPIKWNAEAERLGIRYRVFCASLSDWADNAVPREWRADLATLILKTPNLYWLLLTKRIGNAKAMLSEMFPDGIPHNVWIGATICNQEEADRDIPKLLAVPAAKRFLSMEPLLGPVDLNKVRVPNGILRGMVPATKKLDWVIVGGESGPGARPMHPDWALSLRDQCVAAGVPFLFKQWGEWIEACQQGCPNGPPLSRWLWGDGQPFKSGDQPEGRALFCKAGKKAAGRLLDGHTWDEVPA